MGNVAKPEKRPLLNKGTRKIQTNYEAVGANAHEKVPIAQSVVKSPYSDLKAGMLLDVKESGDWRRAKIRSIDEDSFLAYYIAGDKIEQKRFSLRLSKMRNLANPEKRSLLNKEGPGALQTNYETVDANAHKKAPIAHSDLKVGMLLDVKVSGVWCPGIISSINEDSFLAHYKVDDKIKQGRFKITSDKIRLYPDYYPSAKIEVKCGKAWYKAKILYTWCDKQKILGKTRDPSLVQVLKNIPYDLDPLSRVVFRYYGKKDDPKYGHGLMRRRNIAECFRPITKNNDFVFQVTGLSELPEYCSECPKCQGEEI